jgi:hypothetical protein
MKTQTPVVTQSDLIAYTRELLTAAMNDGYIKPVDLVECVQFAARPALLAVMRALASLDESAQVEMVGFVRRLTGRPDLPCPPEDEHRSRPQGR